MQVILSVEYYLLWIPDINIVNHEYKAQILSIMNDTRHKYIAKKIIADGPFLPGKRKVQFYLLLYNNYLSVIHSFYDNLYEIIISEIS